MWGELLSGFSQPHLTRSVVSGLSIGGTVVFLRSHGRIYRRPSTKRRLLLAILSVLHEHWKYTLLIVWKYLLCFNECRDSRSAKYIICGRKGSMHAEKMSTFCWGKGKQELYEILSGCSAKELAGGGCWWRGLMGVGGNSWVQTSRAPLFYIYYVCAVLLFLLHRSMPEHLFSLSAVNHYLTSPSSPPSPPFSTPLLPT